MALDIKALERLIETGGAPFKSKGRSWVFACPRCRKPEKLWIRKSDGRFVCWYCREIEGYEGRPEYALRDLLGKPLDEICEILYGAQTIVTPDTRLQIDLIDWFAEDEQDDMLVLREVEAWRQISWPGEIYPIDAPEAKLGREYLEARGIPGDISAVYGLHYWPQKRRVIFPVEMDGKLVGYQARTILPTEYVDQETGETYTIPKIVTSTDLKRDRALMFYPRLHGVGHAVLCEGPVDAIKAHKCGGNVATMGKAVTRQQLGLLRNAGAKRIYLALDPDAADETRLLAEELGDLELFLLEPPRGQKDLGDCTFDEVYEAFRSARRIRPGMMFCYLRDPFASP